MLGTCTSDFLFSEDASTVVMNSKLLLYYE